MKLVKLILSVAAVTVLGAGLAYADGGLMGRIWGSEDKPDAVQEKEQGDRVHSAAEHSESVAVKGQKTEEEMSKDSAKETEVKQCKEMKETKTVKEECPSETKKECDEKKKETNGEKKECDEESTKKESESKK